MTNELTTIGSREILGKTVTAFGTVENPLFLAKDVAEWIEHSNVSAMIEPIDDDEKSLIDAPTIDSNDCLESGNLRTKRWFLTENGLYEVLFLSRKPVAKEFKSGVKQLLHVLRTGHSAAPKPTGMALVKEAMDFLLAENETLKIVHAEQQAKIEADRPKVEFANQIGDCTDGVNIREFGLVLRQNGAGFGQDGFVSHLLTDHFVYRDKHGKLRPYAEHVESGLFWEKATLISSASGNFQTFQVKITGKGQQYFLQKYLPQSILPAEAGGVIPISDYNGNTVEIA